jgi:hypothetical protein
VTTGATDLMTTPLVEALERAWAAIRARHPEVPAAVVVLGAGSIGMPAGALKWGHFAKLRWRRGASDLPEVFIGGEGLERGALGTLGTLLHEAAHGLADSRQLKDTSRQGRYHNRRYAELAGELGLAVTVDGTRGWSRTTVPAETERAYADVVEQLAGALRLWRHAESQASTGRRVNSNNPRPCICGCGRRIRVADLVLEQGEILCALCGTPFSPAA